MLRLESVLLRASTSISMPPSKPKNAFLIYPTCPLFCFCEFSYSWSDQCVSCNGLFLFFGFCHDPWSFHSTLYPTHSEIDFFKLVMKQLTLFCLCSGFPPHFCWHWEHYHLEQPHQNRRITILSHVSLYKRVCFVLTGCFIALRLQLSFVQTFRW